MPKHLFNLSATNSIASTYLNELRDIEIQKDGLRFRTNLERISKILAYEASKYFIYQTRNIRTPLGEHEGASMSHIPVIASILRAGLPMHHAVLESIDRAENAFVTAYRRYRKSGEFEIKLEYTSSPSLEGKILLICDPMIATGASILATVKELKAYGTPSQIFLLGVIASKEGIETVQNFDPSIQIFVGAIDEELTARGYIVPGLGDAGDLAYGSKLDH